MQVRGPSKGLIRHNASARKTTAKALCIAPLRDTKENLKAALTPRLSDKSNVMEQIKEEGIVMTNLVCNKAELDDGHLRQRITQMAPSLQHGDIRLQLNGDLLDGEHSINGSLIHTLGVLYDALSQLDPRMYVVPLVSAAGWDAPSISKLQAAPHVKTIASQHDDHEIQTHHSSVKYQEAVHTTPKPPVPAITSSSSIEHTADTVPTTSCSETILPPRIILPGSDSAVSMEALSHDDARHDDVQDVDIVFDHVAVGGTFDRLHCGHELLLATSALVARKKLYVGITADKLLLNKNHRELLQPYEQRRDTAVRFMQAVRPGLQVEAGPLTDPKEPTQAELDPAMQAIVVSQETLPGAITINKGRVARGYAPLLILVVPVIGCTVPGSKLSSTQLRAQDAATAAAVPMHN